MPNQFLSPEGDLENYFVTEYWLIDQWVGDTLWNWGWNYSGQLGSNNRIDRSTPVTTFAGGTNWKQVSCGDFYFTSAIKTDGTLWVWGDNSESKLGLNTDNNTKSTPVTTSAGGTNWKQVSCGGRHTMAVKTDGTLWGWGRGSEGQLGNDGFGNINPGQTSAGGTNWKQVDCGGFFSAAIKTDGTLWLWGSGTVGQLGNNVGAYRYTPVTTFAGGTNWKQVSCSEFHVAAIKTDGTLWVWGRNLEGQMGNNISGNYITTPVTTFAGGTNWKQVSSAGYNTAAIKTDGTLWIWGYNYNGLLGNNGSTNRSTPVTTFAGGTNWKQISCTKPSTFAIKTDGTLWCWGRGDWGSLGNNSIINPIPTPITTFAGGTNWKQVASAGYNAAAITSGTDPTFFIA